MNKRRAQKSLSSLASTCRVSKDQDIIQVNNNTQTLVIAKEQNGFSDSEENPMGHNLPRRKNLPLISLAAPNKP